MVHRIVALLAAIWLAGTPALARETGVRERWLRAHEQFLAGDELAGRGSATHDEAVAAAYVAAQFRAFGLQPAPGQTGYLQTAPIVRRRAAAAPTLTVDDQPVAGAALLRGPGGAAGGTATLVADAKAAPAKAEAVVFTGAADQALAAMRPLGGRAPS